MPNIRKLPIVKIAVVSKGFTNKSVQSRTSVSFLIEAGIQKASAYQRSKTLKQDFNRQQLTLFRMICWLDFTS